MKEPYITLEIIAGYDNIPVRKIFTVNVGRNTKFDAMLYCDPDTGEVDIRCAPGDEYCLVKYKEKIEDLLFVR